MIGTGGHIALARDGAMIDAWIIPVRHGSAKSVHGCSAAGGMA